MGLIVRRDAGNRTLYRIDERRLRDADDPFLEIPQAEFREPLRRFVDRVNDEVPSIAGILCFGSVARGEADRTSDVVRDLEEESIDGDRYEFEVFVESPESARKRGEDLRPILQEGIPLVESETFRRVKRDVFGADG